MQHGLLNFDQLPESFVNSVRAKSRTDAETDAWRKARLGKITGSRFGQVRQTNKGEWGETAQSYLFELVSEWLTGAPADTFSTTATSWGIEHESEALELYRRTTGHDLLPGRFFQMQGMALVGSTPDGLVGEDGVVEAKCPWTPKNHLRTVIRREVPAEYQDQVDGHMLVTGRQWCDFISYDPRIPAEKHRLIIIRVDRDEERMQNLRSRLYEFEQHLIGLLVELEVPIDALFRKDPAEPPISTPIIGIEEQ